MYSHSILFIGGTGKMGRYILHGLVSKGIKVKALVRNPSKAKQIIPDSVELIQGDIQKVSDLEVAFADVDSVFINLNSLEQVSQKQWQPLKQGLATLLVFARMNRVRHVMFHSLIASHADEGSKSLAKLPGLQKMAEQLIETSGIPYTNFRTSFFMENFFHRFRSGNQIRVSQSSNNQLFMISAFEFGQMISRAICNPSVLRKTLQIQGNVGYSLEEAAHIFVNRFSGEELICHKSGPSFMKFLSLVRPQKMEEMNWLNLMTNFEEKLISSETWELLGCPNVNLITFAEKAIPLYDYSESSNRRSHLSLF